MEARVPPKNQNFYRAQIPTPYTPFSAPASSNITFAARGARAVPGFGLEQARNAVGQAALHASNNHTGPFLCFAVGIQTPIRLVGGVLDTPASRRARRGLGFREGAIMRRSDRPHPPAVPRWWIYPVEARLLAIPWGSVPILDARCPRRVRVSTGRWHRFCARLFRNGLGARAMRRGGVEEVYPGPRCG